MILRVLATRCLKDNASAFLSLTKVTQFVCTLILRLKRKLSLPLSPSISCPFHVFIESSFARRLLTSFEHCKAFQSRHWNNIITTWTSPFLTKVTRLSNFIQLRLTLSNDKHIRNFNLTHTERETQTHIICIQSHTQTLSLTLTHTHTHTHTHT